MVTEKVGFHVHIQECKDADKDTDVNSFIEYCGLPNSLNSEFYNSRLTYVSKPTILQQLSEIN